MSEAMTVVKSVRLSDAQLAGIKKAAAQLTREKRITVDDGAVIRFAVDDFLASRPKKAAK